MILAFLRVILYYPLLNLLTFFTAINPWHFAAIGIILLTLTVRLVLLVPSRKAVQAQRKMNQLQPLLAELKTEYGDDRQGLATAQMELYKKNNISPFGSCLLTLIQFPILIALYQAIREGLSGSHIDGLYSFVPHIDHINASFFGINLLNPDPIYLLPVIAAGLQYIRMRMMTPPPAKTDGTPDPMASTQKNMAYILPLTTLLIASKFPAGVSLYWVVTTSFDIYQQYRVNQEKFNIVGVDNALKEADVKHPEHKKRAAGIVAEIQEETHKDKKGKGGVEVTVRRKK